MNSNPPTTPWKSVTVIIVLGLVLAAAILFREKLPGKQASPPAKPLSAAAAAAAAADAAGKPHAEGDAMVPMLAAQIPQSGIQMATAGAATITTALQLPGEVRLNADRTAHIVPRLAGVAESVAVTLGQAVKKGQLLAVIASPELAELRSALAAASSRQELVRLNYQRENTLWQERISAKQDYLQARQDWEEAKIATRTAQSKLAALGVSAAAGALSRYELRAPFDGVIVEKHISPGEAVKADANVFLLSDLSRLWVDIVVTPKDLDAVRVGANATVEATATASGLSATGTVSYVGALLGEQTRSATARIDLANPAMAWRPGLFVDVAVRQASKRVAVAVQSEAIQTIDAAPVVFIKVAEGFKARQVTVGLGDARHVEIVEGLQAGSSYAGAGSFVLKAELGKGSAAHAD